jgi:2-hydroxychromene-2-carboxylate isomerase
MPVDPLVFYFDLFSPYSCLAAYRIESVLPVAPAWQPVWGAPLIAASRRDWMPSFDEGRERRAEIVRRAAEYGMPEWRWPERFEPPDAAAHARWEPPNTLAVMRLATFAERSGVGKAFAQGVFRLAFAEGRDISQIDDAVIGVAVSCGLDADEARAAPASSEIKNALRSATDAAQARGVIGVPTVAVGDQLFWGDDRLAEAAAAAAAQLQA